METEDAFSQINSISDGAVTNCPLTAALHVIGGKWSLIVLYWLDDGRKRFNQLRKLIPAISREVLAATLRSRARSTDQPHCPQASRLWTPIRCTGVIRGSDDTQRQRHRRCGRNDRHNTKEKCRMSIVGRHPAFVDVQQRLNCALPRHFFELRFLSIPKSLRHVRLDDQLIHPKDLAVDLCLRSRSPNLESRFSNHGASALSP
jgi:hypothetical protein